MRILVVEDEPDLASALTVGLRREGYAVDVAGDGTSAVERAEYTPYDLLLLDLNLPDMDGLEVCAAVRAGADPQPRILMLTARAQVSPFPPSPRRRTGRPRRERSGH